MIKHRVTIDDEQYWALKFLLDAAKAIATMFHNEEQEQMYDNITSALHSSETIEEKTND